MFVLINKTIFISGKLPKLHCLAANDWVIWMRKSVDVAEDPLFDNLKESLWSTSFGSVSKSTTHDSSTPYNTFIIELFGT